MLMEISKYSSVLQYKVSISCDSKTIILVCQIKGLIKKNHKIKTSSLRFEFKHYAFSFNIDWQLFKYD